MGGCLIKTSKDRKNEVRTSQPGFTIVMDNI